MNTKEQDSAVNNVPVRAHPMNLFPTLISLNAVVDLGISQLPVMTPNDLVCLLMTYHNTLLATIDKESVMFTKDPFDEKDRRITMDRRIRQGLPSNKE